MVALKTESRVPTGLQPSDLGQAVVSADGRCSLVSFVSSPVVVGRDNVYVVFVTDPALGASASRFEWTFVENGSTTLGQSLEHGEIAYLPQAIGQLGVTVRIFDAGNVEQAALTLEQDITSLQEEIEAAIEAARDTAGPAIGNPDVAREIVNDHSPYHQNLALQALEADHAFERFVYGFIYEGALRYRPPERKARLARVAGSLNGDGSSFSNAAVGGMGVCGVRLPLLAMARGLLPWTELPEDAAPRAAADERLREALASVGEMERIDLFNLVRFPKSNVVQAARIIETLRDRYFNGASFSDVVTGMSGTRAHWIARHFREGPLAT